MCVGCTPSILALKGERQVDLSEFKASLGYIERPRLKRIALIKCPQYFFHIGTVLGASPPLKRRGILLLAHFHPSVSNLEKH